jgi:hypothetical protein
MWPIAEPDLYREIATLMGGLGDMPWLHRPTLSPELSPAEPGKRHLLRMKLCGAWVTPRVPRSSSIPRHLSASHPVHCTWGQIVPWPSLSFMLRRLPNSFMFLCIYCKIKSYQSLTTLRSLQIISFSCTLWGTVSRVPEHKAVSR